MRWLCFAAIFASSAQSAVPQKTGSSLHEYGASQIQPAVLLLEVRRSNTSRKKLLICGAFRQGFSG